MVSPSTRSALRLLLLPLLLLACLSSLHAQASHVVTWSLSAPAAPAAADKPIRAQLTAQIAEGWHIYALTQIAGGPNPMTLVVADESRFRLVGAPSAPAPIKKYDENFAMDTVLYEGSPRFVLNLRALPEALGKSSPLVVNVRYQACNETTCIPPRVEHLQTMISVAAASPAVAAKISEAASAAAAAPAAPAPAAPAPAAPSAPAPVNANASTSISVQDLSNKSLISFVWFAAMMGALSLLTPCVFPMIPITVSYFTNHSGQSRRAAIQTALVYGCGIILTFTALGMALAIVFGAGGVNQLAANPWVNLFITAIFLGFAFSLFGVFFLQAPDALVNKVESLKRDKQGNGVVGALLMGFAFTLTSFTCTAPFVGTLLVMTAQGNWRWPLLGMLSFSTVFAIPFFVLALAPQLISKLPRAGGWMNSVKVVMGLLEIAAAMKFLSNADLVWRWGIFTRSTVLAVWIASGLLIVLYVLGRFRLSHDSPVDSIGPVRMLIALVFLSAVIWLTPGLFGRPLGELEPFLPPDMSASTVASSNAAPATEVWMLNDYDGALKLAAQQNKLVFIDFTGYTCTNCRWMEANMFPRPEIEAQMRQFVRLRLYTDGAGELYARQQKLQQDKFGTVALPFYAIVRPDGSIVKTFPGLTRDSNAFLAFLKQQ